MAINGMNTASAGDADQFRKIMGVLRQLFREKYGLSQVNFSQLIREEIMVSLDIFFRVRGTCLHLFQQTPIACLYTHYSVCDWNCQ